jgi:hypothetical protein
LAPLTGFGLKNPQQTQYHAALQLRSSILAWFARRRHHWRVRPAEIGRPQLS